MKLRIHGNSIRLRLSQTDVAQFRDTGSVESAIDFGGDGGRLTYRLESDENSRQVSVSFNDGEIVISLPKETAVNWAHSDEVGIEADRQLNDGNGALQILIEKDFACLNPRPGNEDANAYPHPLADKLF
jgi:hypothetical protein